MRPRKAAVAIAVSAALLSTAVAAPDASAQADGVADLRSSYRCYASGESVLLTGSGFTPDGAVALGIDGYRLTTLFSDYDGAFSVRLQMPRWTFGLTSLRFTARDLAARGLADAATIRIADPDVALSPAVGPPSILRRIKAWGFFGGASVYAHLKRRGAKRVRTIALGAPRGACGTLDVRRRLFPRTPRPGAYVLQFDLLRRYQPNVDGSVRYAVGVHGPALARATALTAGSRR